MIHSPSPFNRTNPVENLSFPELRRIFLGEQTHWSNGRRITLVMLEPGNSEGQAVLVQIYKMGEKDFNNYSLHGMFTGEIHAAPKALPSSAEVLKFVLTVPGAIGYVKAPDVNDSVKVVRVESRLPSEKDYLLRLRGKPPTQHPQLWGAQPQDSQSQESLLELQALSLALMLFICTAN